MKRRGFPWSASVGSARDGTTRLDPADCGNARVMRLGLAMRTYAHQSSGWQLPYWTDGRVSNSPAPSSSLHCRSGSASGWPPASRGGRSERRRPTASVSGETPDDASHDSEGKGEEPARDEPDRRRPRRPRGPEPGPSGPSPEDEAADARAARDYVEALDDRDGGALCAAARRPGAHERLELPEERGSCAGLARGLDRLPRPARPARLVERARSTETSRPRSTATGARVVATVFTEFAGAREPSIEDDIIYLARCGRPLAGGQAERDPLPRGRHRRRPARSARRRRAETRERPEKRDPRDFWALAQLQRWTDLMSAVGAEPFSTV